MERESEEPDCNTVHPGSEAAAQAERLNPASTAHSKRLKELQNAALQTSLIMAARMEEAANLNDAAAEVEAGSLSERHAGEGEPSNGLPFRSQSVSAPRGGAGDDDPPLPPPPNNNQRDPVADGEEEKTDSNVRKEASEEERTLTDHLNKRLLSSFLEKLNERDLQQALPGVQRLDCAVAAGEEDSNRAAADGDW